MCTLRPLPYDFLLVSFTNPIFRVSPGITESSTLPNPRFPIDYDGYDTSRFPYDLASNHVLNPVERSLLHPDLYSGYHSPFGVLEAYRESSWTVWQHMASYAPDIKRCSINLAFYSDYCLCLSDQGLRVG